MKTISPRAALAMILALIWGCTDEKAPADTRTYRVGLYAAEQASLAEIRPALMDLAGHRMEIMVAVPEASFPSDQLVKLLQDAAAAGVEVRIWPLLPQSKGYWPNETNITSFAAYVDRILAWLQTRKLWAGAVVYDMEPAITYSKSIEKTYDKGLGAVVALMKTHLDPAAHAKARATLTASIKRVQAAGLRAQCVTFPQVLDDLPDGDTSLQDMFDIPVSTVSWHEVSPMVYTTTFEEMSGGTFGPYVVYDYALRTVDAFGDAASIALGVSGAMEDPGRLAAEIAAAKAGGIERIQVYSYRGSLDHTGPAAWHQAFQAPAEVPPEENTTSLMSQFFEVLDMTY